ncbi:MAG: c-type cytochrome domain-containing protein, partial [Gemmataceae bacterium]
MQARTLTILCGMLATISLARADGDPKQIAYERDVLPILKQHCYKCHDGKKQTADFRIDVRGRATKGGESGKTGIVPGDSSKSELYRRMVSKDDDVVMPPKKPIPAEQAKIVKAWIDAGAKWPDALSNELKKTHWAFVPPVKPAVPALKEKGKGQNEIDAFIRAKLVTEKLQPAAPADPTTLVRRLYLDLLGL